ncbi:hypothetical protein ARMGADRAFT_126877 [Armillaria gallica]|uniref:Uncharacterized protein n=1 Tax=Armillaria gallica TaxID=47427 RepID=A0A2H3DE80_ARMGA|nr:hypothetical protein ARMGADRAFT_126877 [Armillaria gallica]
MDIRGGYHDSSSAQYNREHEYIEIERPQDRNIFRNCSQNTSEHTFTSIHIVVRGPIKPLESLSSRISLDQGQRHQTPAEPDSSITRTCSSLVSYTLTITFQRGKPRTVLHPSQHWDCHGTHSAAMLHGHDSSGLPPEIYDAIIDEL